MRRLTRWSALAIAAVALCATALAADAPADGGRKGDGKQGERRRPPIPKVIERFDKGAKAGNGELEADELAAMIEFRREHRQAQQDGDGPKDGDRPGRPGPGELLKRFDADNSGGLNAAELKTAFQAIHQHRERRRAGGGGNGDGAGKKAGGKRKRPGADDAGN